MKTVKKIIINLILMLQLIILTNDVIYAATVQNVNIKKQDGTIYLDFGASLDEYEPIRTETDGWWIFESEEHIMLEIYDDGHLIGYVSGMGDGENGDWGPYGLYNADGVIIGDYFTKEKTSISLSGIVDDDENYRESVIGVRGKDNEERTFVSSDYNPPTQQEPQNPGETQEPQNPNEPQTPAEPENPGEPQKPEGTQTPATPPPTVIKEFDYEKLEIGIAGDAEDGFVITFSEPLSKLGENGLYQLTIQDATTGKTITLHRDSTGQIVDENGKVYASSTSSIKLGNEPGKYSVKIEVIDDNYNVTPRKEVTDLRARDTRGFDGEIGFNEDLDYSLKLDKTVSDLQTQNAGEKFWIEVVGKNGKTLKFDPDEEIDLKNVAILLESDELQIDFVDSSGKFKTSSVEVPRFPTTADLSTKITEKAGFTFYLGDQELSTDALGKIMSNNPNKPVSQGRLEFTLHFEGLNNLTYTTHVGSDNTIIFTEFTNLKFVEGEAPQELRTYLEALFSTGEFVDIPMWIEINGVRVDITLEEGQTYFGLLTGGMSPEAVQQALEEQQEIEEANSEEVSNYALTFSESYKDFRMPSSGVYFVYHDTGSAVSMSSPVTVYPGLSGYSKKPLAHAGVHLDIKDDEGRPLGEYIYYNGSGGYTKGKEYGRANCYPLIGGKVYRVGNPTGGTVTIRFIEVNAELVEISDDKLKDSVYLQSQMGADISVAYIEKDKHNFFEKLERLLARFVRTLANGLSYLVQLSLQATGNKSSVDIDDIIFNHYPETSIDFFGRTSADNSSQIIARFKELVNKWYSVFNGIAVVGYLVILLYIGVRILLSTGGKKQSQYKELLNYWLVGICLLTFFPYVIKYAIQLNNGLVKTIEESKSEVLKISGYKVNADISEYELPSEMEDEEEYPAFAAMMEKNPYTGSSSYMAIMASRAETNDGSLVDAVVYLIMVWQFIMLIIIYYKRVFMIAFLVVIFPWVALSYAIDKIGDGKSQAFSTWTREIMTNIFVQAIHAIIYVFVIGATYYSGTYSGDWLLTIIGISFLFQGEQILKRFVGMEGGSVRNIKDTAKRTIATVTAARIVTKSVADNVIGVGSHLGKTTQYFRQYRTERLTARNMDFFAPEKKTPPARELFDSLKLKENHGFDPSHQGKDFHELADAIQVVNNRANIADPKVLGDAIDKVIKYKDIMDPRFQALMKGLNLSDTQLQQLSDLQQGVVDKLVDGDRRSPETYSELKESIDQDIDIRLQAIFPGDRERRDLVKRALYFRLRDGNRDEKHKIRSTDRIEVKQEMEMAISRRNDFLNPVNLSRNFVSNPFSDEAKASKLSESAKSARASVLSTHFHAEGGKYKSQDEEMAGHIALLRDFSNQASESGGGHSYTMEQTWKAVQYISAHEGDSQANKKAIKSTFGMTAEEIKAVIAEEIGRRYTDTSSIGDRSQFREAVAQGAEARINPIASTEMEKKVAERVRKDVWEEVIEYIQANDKSAGERICYDESLDKISVKDALRRERDAGRSEDEKKAYDEAYASYIVSERLQRNEDEITWVENFAREQLDDLPEVTGAPTYNGLTQQEHEEYSRNLRQKFTEELVRTGATTAGVILGGAIGTGFEIGLSDDKSILEEALRGAAAGALIGDSIAEYGIGREDNVKTIHIINPYTGEQMTYRARKSGLTSELGLSAGALNENEVLSSDDPRLTAIRYDLESAFLQGKQKYEKEQALKKRKSLYDEALSNHASGRTTNSNGRTLFGNNNNRNNP